MHLWHIRINQHHSSYMIINGSRIFFFLSALQWKENVTCNFTVQATSVLTKASVWYEIRVVWANINHVESHSMALAFSLQTDMNQILKWGTLNSCRLRGCKNIRGQSWRSIRNCWLSQIRDWCARGLADLADFFRPPTLTSDIFAASWPTRAYSTSFERSDSYLFGDWKPGLLHDF